MKNLWQDLENLKGGVNNPVELVEEQSEFLKEGTGELFYIEVSEITKPSSSTTRTLMNTGIERDFLYRMDLCSDELTEYSFNIFNIYYGITFYPLLVNAPSEIGIEVIDRGSFNCVDSSSGTRDYFVINSEDEFEQMLEAIFNSEKVRTVLRNMKTIIGDDTQEE